ERILLDLKDKVASIGASISSLPTPVAEPVGDGPDDLVSALLNLGFREVQAQERAKAAVAEHGKEAPLEQLVRAALAG
ncbi:MAG: Holliday junction branch migration protein RuvA, partial [Myxococcota bacterium]